MVRDVQGRGGRSVQGRGGRSVQDREAALADGHQVRRKDECTNPLNHDVCDHGDRGSRADAYRDRPVPYVSVA